MRFEVVEIGPAANKLTLIGQLDVTTVGQVETPFTAAMAASGRSAALDLRQLDFISSLGIRLLVVSARVVTRRGGRVVLFGAQPMVAQVLETMGITQLLPMVGSEEEATALLAA